MAALPPAVLATIEALSDLPGIGPRSAERLVFGLLRGDTGLDQRLARTLGDLRGGVVECGRCHHYCEPLPEGESLCGICVDGRRDEGCLCIVESPADLIALERTHTYRGQYHVLHGVLSPLQKVGPSQLRIASLVQRVGKGEFTEVVLALSGSTEADATSHYLMGQLQKVYEGPVTRLARGIPTGGNFDYLDAGTISRAMLDRHAVQRTSLPLGL